MRYNVIMRSMSRHEGAPRGGKVDNESRVEVVCNEA